MMIVTVALDCDSKRAIVQGRCHRVCRSSSVCLDAHLPSGRRPPLLRQLSLALWLAFVHGCHSAYEPSDDHAAMSDDAASTAGGVTAGRSSRTSSGGALDGLRAGRLRAGRFVPLLLRHLPHLPRRHLCAPAHGRFGASRALALACTFTWSTFVVVFMMGCLNLSWFNDYVRLHAATDVLAKIMYAEVLSGVHLGLSPEDGTKPSSCSKAGQRSAEALPPVRLVVIVVVVVISTHFT